MHSRFSKILRLAAWSVLVGCQSNDSASVNPCEDTAQVKMPVAPDVDLIAFIQFDELVETDETGTSSTYSDIMASFDDFSGYEAGVTPVAPFGSSCVGTLGMPDDGGELVTLNVDEVILSGDTLGEIRMEKDENGAVVPISVDAMFPKKGGETIHVEVRSSDDAGSFPSFTETIDVPFPINNIEASPQGDGSLEIDWDNEDSTYFEITLRTLSGQATTGEENRLRCFFLADDGCFVVPVDAMNWIQSNGATDFSLLVERHSLIFSSIGENALLQIDALRSVKFNISI